MKWVFKILFLGSLCLNVYLLCTEDKRVEMNNLDKDNFLHSIDKVKTAQSSTQKVKNKKNLSKTKVKESSLGATKDESVASLKEVESKEEIEKLKDDYEKQYRKAQNAWKEKASIFLEEGLGYSHQYAEDYFYLQAEREKAINEYMAPFMDSEDEDEPYYFTMEDNIAVSKINEYYLEKLREKLGDEAYRTFMNYKNSYNKDMIKSGKGSYYIEF